MSRMKKAIKPLNNSIGMVICHGKTEYLMAEYIKSNLHLNMALVANDNGDHSIEITDLYKFFNKRIDFKDKSEFIKKYLNSGIELEHPNDYKVFIIMDTDTCEDSKEHIEKQKEPFITKNMFKKHWLSNYIVPIYNSPDIENTFLKARVNSRRIKDNEKGAYYSEIFPTNHDKLSTGSLDEINDLYKKLKTVNSDKSNLYIFVDYCIQHVKSNSF